MKKTKIKLPDKKAVYPTISIITPSFNQAGFVKKTIDSVLSQNYPNLEYFVMDGGSTDGTVEILKKYGKKIKWFSKKDKGQSDAINQGLKMAKGDILYFVNSDDYLLPGSLNEVVNFFQKHKDLSWVTGKCRTIDEKGREVRKIITLYKNIFLRFLRLGKLLYVVNFISQPATFWKREILDKAGFFDVNLHYSMDYDYWLRIIPKYKLGFIDRYLACYRVHTNSKAVTSPETQFKVEYEISNKYIKSSLVSFFHKLHYLLAVSIYRKFLIK